MSELTGMPERGRCEIVTIGREVWGRSADKGSCEEEEIVKGYTAWDAWFKTHYGSEALYSQKNLHGSPNRSNEWRELLWLNPGEIHRTHPVGTCLPLQQLLRNPSV